MILLSGLKWIKLIGIDQIHLVLEPSPVPKYSKHNCLRSHVNIDKFICIHNFHLLQELHAVQFHRVDMSGREIIYTLLS